MIDFTEKFQDAYSHIKNANNVLLVTHNRPDGDALSSTCAMIEMMEALGKKCMAFCVDKPPEQFNFLPHIEKIFYDERKLDLSQYDVLVTLDCGQLSRTKIEEKVMEKKENLFIIEFDHHPRVHDYSDIEIRILQSSSTAEVLYNFFRVNQIKISKKLANCILTGILTDTGNLLYESTTDETIKIASKMMLHGAKYPTILESTWRNKSLSAMKIWGHAMSNLRINKKYNFAYTVITKEQIKESGASDEEFEGVSGFISSLEGVKGLMLLREMDGKIKGSLRSTYPKADISKLAVKLGGGGHPRASGFVVDANLKETAKGWKIV